MRNSTLSGAGSNASAAGLNEAEVEQFYEEGYVVVPDLFDRDDLTPLRREMEGQIAEKLNELEAEGVVTQTYAGESFERRLARIHADSPANAEKVIRFLEGVAGGGYTGIEMFRVITHPKLLKAMESLIGPEIVGSSVYRVRPKMPGNGRGVVPWHQDSGYFSPHCDPYMIVTCWIPLVDATIENGCLSVMPRQHKNGIMKHHSGGHANFLVINDDDLRGERQSVVKAPCPLGGAVLLTNMTPHSSTPNFTQDVRWSIDLRYQAASVPNNLHLMPPLDAEPTSDVLVACYPPEADFVVQSLANPSSVTSYEQYTSRRTHYDQMKHKAYPQRDWKPVSLGV